MKPLLVFVFFIFIMSDRVIAQSNDFKMVNDTESILIKLLESSQKFQTVRSDFEQEKNSSVLTKKAVAKGRFYFKKPAMIKMEYLKPFKYLIVINNGNVTIKDAENVKQFSSGSSKVFKQINDIIIQSVDGSIARNINYAVEFYESDKQIMIVLNPKNKRLKSFINKIQVFFDKKDFSVLKFILEEASGDTLMVTFFNKQQNVNFSDAIFSVK